MIPRARYNKFLIEQVEKRGIPIVWGKEVVGVKDEKEGDGVIVQLKDGETVEGDMLVGCDGLHSKVRNALFGKEEARYMGITQVSEFSGPF